MFTSMGYTSAPDCTPHHGIRSSFHSSTFGPLLQWWEACLPLSSRSRLLVHCSSMSAVSGLCQATESRGNCLPARRACLHQCPPQSNAVILNFSPLRSWCKLPTLSPENTGKHIYKKITTIPKCSHYHLYDIEQFHFLWDSVFLRVHLWQK